MSKVLVEKAVLEQALEALELLDEYDNTRAMLTDDAIEEVRANADAAITALRAALAQEGQDTATHTSHCNQGEWAGVCKYGEEDCPALTQEPVAWMVTDKDGRHFIFRMNKPVISEGETLTPLYTRPPHREQLGLVNIARQLAALADGLEAGNSSAEEAAARLARVAKGVVG